MNKRYIFVVMLMGIFCNPPSRAEESAPVENTWPAYMQGLVPLGERLADQIPVDPQDPLLRQEMYRRLYARVAEGYFVLLYQDPKYPEFWPVFNQAFNWGFPNPDDAYYQSALEDNGIYKISGFRGTVRIIDFQIGSGQYMRTGEGWPVLAPTLRNFDLDHDAHVRKDGSFEIILSAERPKGYKGDWWKLDPKASYVWVRQVSYDWLHEVDGRLTIERLDTPAIKPRDTAEQIATKMRGITAFVDGWVKLDFLFDATMRKRGLINKVAVVDWSGQGGISTQRYVEGIFDIGPDEALILETEIPKQCRYWMFMLTDEQSNTLDWTNRQTTLNGYTARLDKDGKFRAVISSKDPGVPNWLDAADYQRGHIYGRWKECSSYPEPSIKKVNVADVRQYLPADTPVVSAEARDASLRLHRKGAQLRRRW